MSPEAVRPFTLVDLAVAVRLDKPLKRELEFRGALYSVTVSPDGVSVAPKGRRKRRFIGWGDLISGDAELARDLRISLDAYRREP